MGEAKTGETQYVEQAYTELNPLTGLYYSHNFFKKADEYLGQAKPKDYCLVAIDIEHFRLFNKLYGRDSGDELLIYIAECVKLCSSASGIKIKPHITGTCHVVPAIHFFIADMNSDFRSIGLEAEHTSCGMP